MAETQQGATVTIEGVALHLAHPDRELGYREPECRRSARGERKVGHIDRVFEVIAAQLLRELGLLEWDAADGKASGPLDLSALLARLASQFLPEKATGFNATLLFKVDGQAATLEIKDKACSVKPPVPLATCTITTDAATLSGIVDATLDGQKAFSEGKIKVTHLPSWMKFRQMFTFAPEKGLKRALIGRKYGGAALLPDSAPDQGGEFPLLQRVGVGRAVVAALDREAEPRAVGGPTRQVRRPVPGPPRCGRSPTAPIPSAHR